MWETGGSNVLGNMHVRHEMGHRRSSCYTIYQEKKLKSTGFKRNLRLWLSRPMMSFIGKHLSFKYNKVKKDFIESNDGML